MAIFTENELRIFLSAMSREMDICRKVDQDIDSGENLVQICNSILNKISRAELKRYGYWKTYKDEHTCSECDSVIIADVLDGEWGSNGKYDYCPYCGATMVDKIEGALMYNE